MVKSGNLHFKKFPVESEVIAVAKKKILTGSSADLANLLKITQRRTNQLADEKVLTRQPEGNFNLPDAIAEFYAYKYKESKSLDRITEKALHEKVKRENAELDLQERRHELHRASDVELVMSDMLVKLRTRLLGIPMTMAPKLEGLQKGEIAELLDREIESALMELKDYTPTMFDDAGKGEQEDGSAKDH